MQPVRIQVLEQDGSNHPGLAKGAKPLRLHRYFRGSLVLKFYLLGQVVQFSLWGGQGIVPRTMSMGKRGKLAARSVAGQLLEYQPCVPPPKYSSTNQFFKTTSKSIPPFCLKTYSSSAENETRLLKEVPVDCWETPFPNNSCQSEAACLSGTS